MYNLKTVRLQCENTSVNIQDAFSQTTCQGGLGRI